VTEAAAIQSIDKKQVIGMRGPRIQARSVSLIICHRARTAIVSVLILIAPGSASVRASAAPDSVAAEPDTTAQKGFGYAFIPAVFYTPETGLAGGAAVLLFFRGKDRSEEARPSTLAPTLIFTEKSQVIALVGYELNLSRERYRISGGGGFLKFPDLFWGIGPDTPDANEEDYTPRSVLFSSAIERRVRSRLGLGLNYEVARAEISEKKEGGLLDSGKIPGSDGGTVSGLGPLITWDSRDNLFYATHGSFHTLSATFFDRALGSDFTFQRYIVDLRTYFSVLEANVVALQAVGAFIGGDPPFQMMSRIGGSELMRGYYDGRYRDKHAIVMQAEWRRRLWWRLGAAAFVGVGDVAPKLSEFRVRDFKPAVGGGVRFLIDRGEGISVRMDFGLIGGAFGPYFTINEAF
jgi:hypothetical protein